MRSRSTAAMASRPGRWPGCCVTRQSTRSFGGPRQHPVLRCAARDRADARSRDTVGAAARCGVGSPTADDTTRLVSRRIEDLDAADHRLDQTRTGSYRGAAVSLAHHGRRLRRRVVTCCGPPGTATCGTDRKALVARPGRAPVFADQGSLRGIDADCDEAPWCCLTNSWRAHHCRADVKAPTVLF